MSNVVASQTPLYFFWDYAITEDELREILRGENRREKIWAISRILQFARWQDIWNYLTLRDVQENWEEIEWRTPELKELWAHALEVWNVRR